MKTILSLFSASLSVVLFSILVLCGYLLYMNFFSQGFLYYAGLIGVGISFCILFLSILILCYIQKKKGIDRSVKELFLSLLSATFLVYSFHITFPTVINRGISLYVISRLESTEGQSIDTIRKDFLDGYVDSYSTVCRRVDEQVSSGNVSFEDGKYTITRKGENILAVLRGIASLTGQDPYYIKKTEKKHPPLFYEVQNGRCRRVD